MKTDKDIGLKVLTLEEYNKNANEFYAVGDADGFLKFQQTNSILYADPIPKQDKDALKSFEVPEISEDVFP